MKKALKMIGLLAVGFTIGFIAAPNGNTVIETVQKGSPGEVVIETEPVFEDDRIKIIFMEVNKEGVKFIAENKTDITITVQSSSISVNGISSNDIIMSDEVSPNSKGYITARTEELAEVGAPEKASGNFRIIDFNDSFESYSATFTDMKIK